MTTVLQWNARGVIRKWAKVKQMFAADSFQVICLQETHFVENDRYSFNIPHFSLYSAYSPDGDRRGGVSIYVSNKLPHMKISIRSTLQVVVCSVRRLDQRISFCSLYLPPNDAFSFQELSNVINQLPPPFVLCTDANSKHPMWGSRQCDRRGRIWMDIINYHDLHILNDGRATRLDESTGDSSHIDLTVVSNDIAHELEWTVDADLHSSDHFPIQLHFSTPDHPPDVPHVFSGWNVRKANWTAFQMYSDFTFDPDLGVVNCDIITQTIMDQAKAYIPP